jgi:hypothetical protein
VFDSRESLHVGNPPRLYETRDRRNAGKPADRNGSRHASPNQRVLGSQPSPYNARQRHDKQ